MCVVALANGCGGASVSPADAGADATQAADGGTNVDAGTDSGLAAARAKIQHVILINQENRSFDHYFGTFPGADGIPMDGGVPTVCSPCRTEAVASRPTTSPPTDGGGPHGAGSFTSVFADGGMNGFIQSADVG